MSVYPTNGLVTTEEGGTATFTVVLDSQPSSTVTVAVSSIDVDEGVVSASSIAFTVGDWDILQTMTVTGVSDLIVDGNIVYNITTSTTSLDTNFHATSASYVSVENQDGT